MYLFSIFSTILQILDELICVGHRVLYFRVNGGKVLVYISLDLILEATEGLKDEGLGAFFSCLLNENYFCWEKGKKI